MQFTVQSTGGLGRRIEVEVPRTRVAGEVDRRLRDLSRTASIRGFRKGKVPLNVIKQQYGSQVRDEAVTELIRQGYSEAVTKEKLRPAGTPNIEPIQMDPAEDLKFAAILEVMPDVVINPVAALQIDRPTYTIGEEDVDAMLESMRRQRATFAPVDRPARKGDRVTVEFVGRLDGKEFEGGSGSMPVVIGSGRAIADFESALEGMSKDEKKTAPVKFPDNYGAAELAGKQAEFDLTAKLVEEQVLPPVDDEFARAFGLGDAGVAGLRNEVRGSMEREASEAVRNRLRNQVFEALQRENQVELPRALVEEQIYQLQMDMMQRMGGQADPSRIPGLEVFKEPAERRVKLGLLIGELIRRENIQIDRARVLARVQEMASAYPNPDEVQRSWLQNQDAMRQIETAVMEDLAVEWVLGRASVTDRNLSFAELTGFRKPE